MLPLCADQGLGFSPFSPLAGGWLTGKYRRGEEAPAGSRMTLRSEPYEHLLARRRLRLARAPRADGRPSAAIGMAELALAWLLASPLVHPIVVGPRRPGAPRAGQGALELHAHRQRHRRALRALPALARSRRMSIRVLSGADVEQALTMRDCIEAMDTVLREHAAGELYLPLRSVVRPPKSPAGFMGLMTAHRAGAAPAFGLKAVAIFPDNPTRGLDAHQGVVVVFDGDDGRVTAVLDASAVTAIRTAAVSAVATRALAREGSSALAVLGAGVQARSHIEAMACVMPLERVRIYARRRRARAGAGRRDRRALRHRCDRRRLGRGGAARRRRRGHDDDGARAHRRARLADARSARQRGRLEHPDDARARRRDDGRRAHLRRRRASRPRNESGDILLAQREGTLAGDVDAERARRGAARQRTRAARAPDELTVFVSLGPRGRGPRRRRARAARRRGRGPRRRGAAVIPLDAITRARATLAGVAVRTPLVRLRLDDAPAEIYLKLESLQPIGSFKIRGALNAMAEAPPGALAQGVVTASAGNMAQGVAWGARERGIPCTVVVPDHAPQTKLDAIERLGGRVVRCRSRTGGARSRPRSTRAPRATSSTPCSTTA